MHTHQMTAPIGGQTPQAILREQDVFTVILNLLKNTAREYATAVTEASCPNVRQTMQNMLNETLSEQADCYQVMNRQGWYPPASRAARQDVQQAIQKHRQAAGQLMQIVGQGGFYGEVGRQQPPMHQPQPFYPPQQAQPSWRTDGQPLHADQWRATEPQHQAVQGQHWNSGSGPEWETGGHVGQVPAYDSQAWRYGVRQHGGETTQ